MVKISSEIPVSMDQQEVLLALEMVTERYGPFKRILEIGSLNGFNFNTLVRTLKPELAVSLDLPGGVGGKKSSAGYLSKVADDLREDGFKVVLGTGNSQEPGVITDTLAFGPFDLVYIDGDHSHAGAWLDLSNYPAPVILMHDINNPGFGVHGLWQTLRAEHDTQEICLYNSPRCHLGVGIIHGFHER